ncbi:MAG: GT4 family glycosyltransferase PelF [Candidatus Omnitrophota bacterium]
MNVLQVLPELNVGGVERGTLDLASYLVREGHKAVVVSAGGQLVADLEAKGAIHYKLAVHKKSIFSIIKMIPLLSEIIKKEDIDIVHARSRVPALIAYFAARKTRAVFITTCHGYYKKHPFSYVMGWGKRVIVLSNVIARHMIDDFNVPNERIRLVARSVDLTRFKYEGPAAKRKEEFNVGIIGRITPLKGHSYFIKAMAKLARINPRLKIWIVGDAPQSKQAYKEELQVLVKRLGLSHCTEFLGNQRDIPGILSHLDLLVLATTAQEAFGRVIIEAQASGVPVVATEVGGVVDIIENKKTGMLVPPADPQRIAEAALKIYEDREFAEYLARNAYEKVKEKYSLDLMVKNTMDVYQDALNNFKILVIKFSSLGDLVLSTAAIKAVREKFYAKYKISFLTSDANKEVLLRCPHIDELLIADFSNKDKGMRGLLNLGRALRKKNFDIVIDLQNNRKSHILSFLSLALARYGYKRKFGFLLNNGITDEGVPMAPLSHQFRILNSLGIELKEPRLELWPSEEDGRYVEEFLNSQWLSVKHNIVGINISASAKWLTKNLPCGHIARICEELERKDIRVVFTGTEKDAGLANSIISRIKDAKPINACAKTSVNQLACLIKRCKVYISPDSASLHIACAMGVPFVALFGPTDPKRHIPPGKGFIVIKKELPCSPCYRPRCRSRKCMELIDPKEVLEAVEKLMQ